ncbi:MAG TPA: carbamoyl-phosphate synthase large subunit [Nitrospiria bacterium]
MPKRTDIQKILIIGSGPIVIGQGCEFDYSGTQACKALREEGYEIILVNSNPATIMTDPETAHRTYVEPINAVVIEKIIEAEKPHALLPTMGGQTALNMAFQLSERGILDKYGVKLIGASYEAIQKAENREAFKNAIIRIGLKIPESCYVRQKEDAQGFLERVGFPVIIRPSFTLGGTGGSIAYNIEEFQEYLDLGLDRSPTHEVLIERSVLGWKEFELEVMRDLKDNVVVICSIENLDPMGIHTGDSITVAPAQTLTDKEYQIMRDAAIRVIREIGVETGGSNIQFAVNPVDGEMVVIEMNPRVSRSSALASKATGFPIAKIAAKLSVGYTLDEIQNDITQVTPSCFEPMLDYVVVKIPRFTFEKFPEADSTLNTQMKSVGEAMAMGHTFKEAFQKALRSLEIDCDGLTPKLRRKKNRDEGVSDMDLIRAKLVIPNWERIWYLADGIRLGISPEEIHQLSRIDPWFINQIHELIKFEDVLKAKGLEGHTRKEERIAPDDLRRAKRDGFSDPSLGSLLGLSENEVRDLRWEKGIEPVYKRVDTCAAEFEAFTPYLYSTYEQECESNPTHRNKVIILGGGPNRIGQGIEFDYCCVHGAMALREENWESIMVNCNPETVSTDYDTSDRLYFEPLTIEDVIQIIRVEKPQGVVVQFGGQTPLKLAVPLEKMGVSILGTSPDSIDRAEDRERFKTLLEKLRLKQPQSGLARSVKEAIDIAKEIQFPILVRPSYVLGGRAMEIVYDEENLKDYMRFAVKASPNHPILIDRYLEDAIEIDVDALCDGKNVFIGGIMEHIEEAGVHSGDSACSLPPYSLLPGFEEELRRQTKALAIELEVVGLMNVQFAIKENEVYVIEVNPRASRTVPFVSKAIGIPLAKLAMKVMLGRSLHDLGVQKSPPLRGFAVKEAVFPFSRFMGVDPILGPEMKSTGEVMGIGQTFGEAFGKSQAGANVLLPGSGKVFISVKDKDKPQAAQIGTRLRGMGFQIEATRGTADFLQRHGVDLESVNKVKEGRPHIVDHMKNNEIGLVINTVGDKTSQKDSYSIRRTALNHNIPYFTTMAGARAAIEGIEDFLKKGITIQAIQDYHSGKP